ncbi:hypothetical protein ACFSOZ_29725 [Mesorhizobium newzealandense]|uniref:Uncharacterized protein n=1 Tax=Mesorhizobium newzealandense TaxID=1300302 RepID=A0ABW4UK94_9HYPH
MSAWYRICTRSAQAPLAGAAAGSAKAGETINAASSDAAAIPNTALARAIP